MSGATQENISEAIRSRREAVGLSREGLAYKAGISLKTLERLEAGKNIPRRATLAVIETALAEEAA
jgi:ribosome-binding protein aMBF1 (putative translation factor)